MSSSLVKGGGRDPEMSYPSHINRGKVSQQLESIQIRGGNIGSGEKTQGRRKPYNFRREIEHGYNLKGNRHGRGYHHRGKKTSTGFEKKVWEEPSKRVATEAPEKGRSSSPRRKKKVRFHGSPGKF